MDDVVDVLALLRDNFRTCEECGRLRPLAEFRRHRWGMTRRCVECLPWPGRPPVLKVRRGRRFGRGVVTDPEVRQVYAGKTSRCVRLRCDCGNEYLAPIDMLLRGGKKSCGCAKGETRNFVSAGDRFGLLTVTDPDGGRNRHNSRLAVCACDCGKTARPVVSHLLQGLTWSCGCRGTGYGLGLFRVEKRREHDRRKRQEPGYAQQRERARQRARQRLDKEENRRKVRDWTARNGGNGSAACRCACATFSSAETWEWCHPASRLEHLDPAGRGLITRRSKNGPVWGWPSGGREAAEREIRRLARQARKLARAQARATGDVRLRAS